MDYVAIGARIRRARKMSNLTQSKLAERVEISTSFLGHIERGSRIASIETMARIAIELELSLDTLVFGPEHGSEYPLPKEMSVDQRKTINDVLRVLIDNYNEWK
ncbi:MAG: helix-turn-helix transcriptional regulator [Clostridia bacterium]